MIKPFNAPRKVTLGEEDYSNSNVQAITETGNARDQEARQDKDVFVNPYPLFLFCVVLSCAAVLKGESGERQRVGNPRPRTTTTTRPG